MAEWVKTFRYMKENVNTGEMQAVYHYDCPECGYGTGNQGRYFNYCPICGTHLGSMNDGKTDR